MNPRIEKLRQQSLDTQPSVSAERALLVTEYYQSEVARNQAPTIKRAGAFCHILQHKEIWIGEGELIVGERGPSPKATPTYPEVCLHSVDDLNILNIRERTPYKVDDDTINIYAEKIIPFWQGRSLRERLFDHMIKEWQEAYEAGIFTEFQEQRSPGHTVLGERLFQESFSAIKARIESALAALDFVKDPHALDKEETLRSMATCADALVKWAQRYAKKLKEMAAVCTDLKRRAELIDMAMICERVPDNAPQTFWEALQHYWFIHLGVIIELNPWDAFNPGRLDQHLYPFYQRDIDAGRLTPAKAKELLQVFWIKFNNHPAPPKTGVTAKESNTYVDFALINTGGVTADNEDAVNELSYLILDVVEEMRLLQPSSMVQISKKNPDRFLHRALKIVRTGFGQPSIFNTDAIVQELVRQGKSVVDARMGGASGCVEAGAFGREAYFLTGYFNLCKVLEVTLHNGIDPRSGKRIGLETGDAETFTDFDTLYNAFEKQLNHFINIKIRGNNTIERLYAKYMPAPFLSLVIDDCIENACDYHAGGARYNTSYIQGVGLGSITDSLSAIKFHLYDKKRLEMPTLLEALNVDFRGYDQLHDDLINQTPKYGNDDDAADKILKRVFESYYAAVNGKPNTRGGVHRVNLLPTTCHVYFGSVIGALPDGRRSGQPLSEGISPVQGADRNGPTAVLKSAAKIDHIRTGGTLLNQKFLPQVLADEVGITKLGHLVRSYFSLDGHHIQFNVVDIETLREAQKEPAHYRDLIVRVAGYSDYFVDLTPELQEEIIQRTAHAE